MTSPVVEYASPATSTTQRLLSLDVFRGLVILAMLVVNNIGDAGTTGYFWKHADWPVMRWGQAWKTWATYARGVPNPYQRIDALRDLAMTEAGTANNLGVAPSSSAQQLEA